MFCGFCVLRVRSSHARQLLHGVCVRGAERDGEEEHPAEQGQQHGRGLREGGQHVEGIHTQARTQTRTRTHTHTHTHLEIV